MLLVLCDKISTFLLIDDCFDLWRAVLRNDIIRKILPANYEFVQDTLDVGIKNKIKCEHTSRMFDNFQVKPFCFLIYVKYLFADIMDILVSLSFPWAKVRVRVMYFTTT